MTRTFVLTMTCLLPVSGSAAPGKPAVRGRESSMPTNLVQAYQKEFAFLSAQKKALATRLERLQTEAGEREAAAKTALGALQQQILAKRLAADQIEESLRTAERISEKAADQTDLLGETLQRGEQTLERFGRGLPPAADQTERPAAVRLKMVFEAALLLLQQKSSVRQEKGEFFLPDGRQTSGTLIHLGDVASYGVSPVAAGALAPVGGSQLKLWPAEASQVARSLATGQPPPTLGVFLYESRDKAIAEKQAKTVVGTIQKGGIIAWIIVGLGMLAIMMIIARLVILLRAGGAAMEQLIHVVQPMVARGKQDQAAKHLASRRGVVAQVLSKTIRSLRRPREELEDVVSEAILHEAPTLERFGSTLTVIAAVAPLLGLLGTVTGIIATFDVITEHGTGDPKLLSGGISEALITTELGLIVAIPTLLIGNLLNGRAQSILAALERAALRLINVTSGGLPDSTNEQETAPEQEHPGGESRPIKPELTPAMG